LQSFENLEHWREDFLHNAAPPDPDNFPFLVLGNKSDLESDRKVCHPIGVVVVVVMKRLMV